jgi:hypothetical protein
MKTTKAQAGKQPKKTSEARKATGRKKNSTGGPESIEDKIREKAKEIYLERIASGKHGTAEDDWLKAEELIKGSKK